MSKDISQLSDCKYRELLLSIPEPFFIIDTNLKIIGHHFPENFLSPHSIDALSENKIKLEWHNIFSLLRMARQVKKSKSPRKIEIATFIQNWEQHFSFQFSNLPGNELFCIVRNITDRKIQENELSKYRNSLENLVNEKTIKLQNALQLAKEANFAKSNFLANITHELRTPIHAVLSFSDIGKEKIAQGKDLNKISDYFDLIYKSTSRLLDFLNNIIEFSNLEVETISYRFEPVYLYEIFQRIKMEFEPFLKKKNLTLSIPDLENLDTLELDAPKITQLLRHLINNAIYFSPNEGLILVTADFKYIDPITKVKSIKINVKDQGPGIPNYELEKVFESFTQSSFSHQGTGGVGLGLAICKSIVHGHNGKIWAENSPNGGAILSFTLPLQRNSQ